MFYAGVATGIVIGIVAGFFICGLMVVAKDSDERSHEIYEQDRMKLLKTSDEYYGSKGFLN